MICPSTMAIMLQMGTPQAARGLGEIEREEKGCWWERQVGVAEGAWLNLNPCNVKNRLAVHNIFSISFDCVTAQGL